MATFRCKRSGNLVRFTLEHDIAGLRKHEGYEEVIETDKLQPVVAVEIAAKKRGRPRTVEVSEEV